MIMVLHKTANASQNSPHQNLTWVIHQSIGGELATVKKKPSKDGGIVIGCNNREDNAKLLIMVQQKMSDSYNVKILEGIQPRIKIVGISENFTLEFIMDYLFKCNAGIFVEKSECKELKILPSQKKSKIFQVSFVK